MSPIRRPLPLLAGLLLSLTTACAWSVPAEPGENARLRARPPAQSAVARDGGRPAGAVPDAGAREVYERRCGACHAPFSPRHAAPDQWPGLVRKYGPRAGLFGEERARVLRWLAAAAR